MQVRPIGLKAMVTKNDQGSEIPSAAQWQPSPKRAVPAEAACFSWHAICFQNTTGTDQITSDQINSDQPDPTAIIWHSP